MINSVDSEYPACVSVLSTSLPRLLATGISSLSYCKDDFWLVFQHLFHSPVHLCSFLSQVNKCSVKQSHLGPSPAFNQFLGFLLYLKKIERASQVALVVRNCLPMQETGDAGSIPDQEDPLEEGTATPSSILVWRIPWTEEPHGLLLKRVRRDWAQQSFQWFLWSGPYPGILPLHSLWSSGNFFHFPDLIVFSITVLTWTVLSLEYAFPLSLLWWLLYSLLILNITTRGFP